MIEPAAEPERRIRLDFRRHDQLERAEKPIRSDLSTVTAAGRCLWTANDELATVERLVRQADGSYGDHQPIQLAELFDLPEGAEGEMDIEGLDVADGFLWIAGSHGLTREKPKPGEHDAAEALARLTEIEHHPNRHFLGRVPLVETGPGLFELRPRATGPDGTQRRCACLKMTSKGNRLDRSLRKDVHIARFLEVPAKENGFDIEGIAVRGDRVLLGLRGPVLRGWAMLIELEIEETTPGRLKLKKIGPDGERYLKHFLDLKGLGIRELTNDGDALLILAGPTMDLDGPIALYRWPDAFEGKQQAVVINDRLEMVLPLPFGRGADHPEGICWLPDGGAARELLVVYDSPADHRLRERSAIEADVFRLGGDTAKSRRRPRSRR
jgi:Protein of unknown function (DUF3616)